MKVSVIVPVYNVELYIRECILSIINQTFKDFEVVIVNDGSTDNSIKNIEDIINTYNNVILINKENGGLSSARNEGLKIAKGDYIAFVDSDDYLQPNFLKNLYEEAIKNNLDISIGGYTKKYTNSLTEIYFRDGKLFELEVTTGSNFLYHEFLYQDYRMEVWSSLYKRSFLEMQNLEFINSLLHEDEHFTPQSLLKANRVKLVNSYDYMYRQRDESIMTTQPTIKHVQSLLFILKDFIKKFDSEINSKNKILYTFLISHLVSAYECKIFASDITNKKESLFEIKKLQVSRIIKYNRVFNIKTRFKYLLLKGNWNLYYFYMEKKFIKIKAIN